MDSFKLKVGGNHGIVLGEGPLAVSSDISRIGKRCVALVGIVRVAAFGAFASCGPNLE